MKSEIKQRIEQIRRGEVPEGYKKLPFGILPDDWKVKKLCDVLKKQTQKNKDNSVHNVLTNSATQGIISQMDYFDKKIANDENTNGYYLVQPGNFVYNPRISNNAPCGPFNRYNGNQYGIMSPLYTVYCFTDKSLAYSDYLSQYFLSSKWHAYMNGIANYGARSDRMNVLSEDMDNMPLPYPSSHEAQKIAEILSTQDKVIELYEKKIEQLQLLKKICLQKMFPKQGKNVPEVRFPGFTEPWEQRKLSSIYKIICNAFVGTATPYYVSQGHFYLESNNVKDGQINRDSEIFINDEFYYRQKNKWLHTNDMVMVQSGHVGHSAVIPENLDKTAAHALIMFTEQIEKTEPYFLNYQYQTLKAIKKISDITKGNTIKHILSSDMQKFVVDISSLDEQKLIARFFQNLDHFITLHQRRLDEEKRKKKALMQLLLTGIVRV